MATQIIPLTASPNQAFSARLQVDGKSLTLNLALRWSAMAGYWVMTISDSLGNLLVDSLPLLTGWYPASNMLAQQGYLNIGSAMILNLGSVDSDFPGIDDLGSQFILLWSDTAP